MRGWRRMAAAVVMSGALGSAGLAYMASNTVAPSSGGQGSGTVTFKMTASAGKVSWTASSFPLT